MKLRKQGFVSMRGPSQGGVVCTRRILWPGGQLVINVDAREGEVKVRVTDAKRKVIDGFDYSDCESFSGDEVSHTVSWRAKSLDSLAGRVIRFEFFLKDADLYTFRATRQSEH